MIVCVVGIGLIGGSVCKALKAFTTHTVLGLDTDLQTCAAALRDGAVDEIIDADGLGRADVTIVCLYPDVTQAFLTRNMRRFKPDSVVCDFCGIKTCLAEPMTRLALECGVRYVSAHPMAGREVGGYANSLETLYVGKNFIVTPVADTDEDAKKDILLLAVQMGVTRTIEATPEAHDRTIAYTSQLAHIVSSAYVKSPTILQEAGFTGGSFQDMTRVATVNEHLWTALFMRNADPLLCELDILIENLSQYRAALCDRDAERLQALLRDGRLRKEENLRNDPTGI